MSLADLALKRVDGGPKGRYYELPDGRRAPSVTAILERVIHKPNVERWKVQLERDAVIQAASDLYVELGSSPAMNRMVYREALRGRLGLNKEHERRSAKAKDVGTQVHDLIAWNLRKEAGLTPIDKEPALCEEGKPCFTAFQAWRAAQPMKIQAIEQMVYHPDAKFAGTLDWTAIHEEAGLGVGDFKSGGLYRESELQIAAYAMAVDLLGFGPVQWGLVVRLPKEPAVEFNPALHTRFYFRSQLEENYQAFEHAIALWNWLEGAA